MGGNALNGVRETRRYQAAEYFELMPDVIARARSIVGVGANVAVVPAYRAKESFGDMDVLVDVTHGSAHAFRQSLGTAFATDYVVTDGTRENQLDVAEDDPVADKTAEDIANSGRAFSLAYKDLQIDVIPLPTESFHATLSYYSYNDCGNLLGAIVGAFGFKLGHQGLTFQFKHGTFQFAELVVARDWRQVLPAFGWDYETWAQGFEDLESIFKFVVTSPFFNKEVFQLTNRNARNRVRDRKRSTYSGFLAWLEEQPEGSLPMYDFKRPSSELFDLMFERLRPTGFTEQFRQTERDFAEWQLAKARFNGQTVAVLTGLEGKALSLFMETLRNEFPSPEAFRKWVAGNSAETVDGWVRERFSKHTITEEG